MALATSLTTLFGTVGDIVSDSDIAFTRNSPLMVSVSKQYIGTGDERPYLHAWIYKRYNGTSVLRMDIATATYEITDKTEIDKWILKNNCKMPFVAIRKREGANDLISLLSTHSMIATEVTEDSLSETVSSLVYMWRKCEAKIIEIDQAAHIAAEEEEEIDEVEDEDDNSVQPPSSNNDSSKDRDIYMSRGRVDLIEAGNETGSILTELENLIGLEPVKAMVHQLAAQQRIAKMREAQGFKVVVPSPHLVFVGNPGTGKTTVARLIGKLYKSLGLLSKGHVVEAERNSLVSGYLGQTALKTREVCERALNGVLFIDEAYGLAVEGRDYGQEVIETLLTFMESHRNEFVLVVAGYPDKMNTFLDSNPGVKSRFDLTLDFPDYNMDELTTMFKALVKENDYTLTDSAVTALMLHIGSWTRGPGFGNGREVRRLFNAVVGNQAALLAQQSNISADDLCLITEEAIPAPEITTTVSHIFGQNSGSNPKKKN